MMFNWKRLVGIVGLIVAIIIIDIVLHSVITRGIPTNLFTFVMIILVVALIGSPVFDFFMLKNKIKVLYPELKHRALEVAKKKRGFVAKGDMGKVASSELYGGFVKKLETEGLVMKNPMAKDQIIFKEIAAESNTVEELMERNLPMDVGSVLLAIKTEKEKESEE